MRNLHPWHAFILDSKTGHEYSRHHTMWQAARRFRIDYLDGARYEMHAAETTKDLARIQAAIQAKEKDKEKRLRSRGGRGSL